jgi:hypothetical protein
MTKVRQRERKKRMQRAAATQRVLAAAEEREMDEATVKIIDVMFRDVAEKAAAENNISVEDAIESSWTMFEDGFLRLVAVDGDGVGIVRCRANRVEQHAQAKANRPLVEIRRRLLAETEGGPVG